MSCSCDGGDEFFIYDHEGLKWLTSANGNPVPSTRLTGYSRMECRRACLHWPAAPLSRRSREMDIHVTIELTGERVALPTLVRLFADLIEAQFETRHPTRAEIALARPGPHRSSQEITRTTDPSVPEHE